ncbi:hypothetical protein [Streptomyces sp. NPDC005507]|uniref:hypothetical protein n=1 Tax=Streptomyces sp. NPDC005507 TaxID=3154885 RepID=UPI0033A5FBC2
MAASSDAIVGNAPVKDGGIAGGLRATSLQVGGALGTSVLVAHRGLLRRRHARASCNEQTGRPRTVRSIRALILRPTRENSTWGYRRIHGELATLGIKIATSTARGDPPPRRGFADAFMTAFPEAIDFAADRERTAHAVAELASRAQETGQLHPGFVVDDLILMLMAHRCVQDAPRAARLTASRRFAAYVIEAFRAAPETGAPAPLPPAPRLQHPRSPTTP